MDRPLSREQKRKILIRQISFISLIVIIPVLIILFFKNVFNQSVSLTQVTTSVTGRGNIQITIQGSGVVVPAYEEVITSPFRSNVLKILKSPGTKVKQGDILVLLDNKLADNELSMLRNELDLKNIRIDKYKIELQQLREDFEFSRQIKEIRVENARLAYEAEKALNKMGGSPAYNVKKSMTEWEIEKLENSQALFNYNNQVNSRNNGIRELETEINIQKNKIVKAEEIVKMAFVKSPFDGDLSWIVSQPGATVSEGQEVARVADLSHFKLKGNLSNSYAGRVMAGQKVEVRNQGKVLMGEIENIMPSVNQGMMECQISLGQEDSSFLRTDQQVEIRVITSYKDDVLRIPNGTYYKDRGYKEMYIIRGKNAYRTKILLGDANFDYVEVLDGLKEGETIILSDISEKFTRDIIKVKK